MPKTYWQLTFALALATLLMSAYLFPMFPATAHGDVSGYGSPVIAFEMASSAEHLEAIFGPQGDPQRVIRIEQMDRGNRWDFGFMFLYAMFLGLFSVAAYRSSGHSMWLVPAFIGVLSGGFDAIENIMLLKLSHDIDTLHLLSTLWIPVYAKFIAIAVSGFGAAYYIYSSAQLVWKLLSAAAMLAALASLVTLISPSQYGWLLTATTSLCWLLMLAYSAYRAFSKL